MTRTAIGTLLNELAPYLDRFELSTPGARRGWPWQVTATATIGRDRSITLVRSIVDDPIEIARAVLLDLVEWLDGQVEVVRKIRPRLESGREPSPESAAHAPPMAHGQGVGFPSQGEEG